jgi:hypothetical protein
LRKRGEQNTNTWTTLESHVVGEEHMGVGDHRFPRIYSPKQKRKKIIRKRTTNKKLFKLKLF